MAHAIISFLTKLTPNKTAVAALLAVVPVTEIKGAILYAVLTEGKVWIPAIVAYLSSLLPAALLAFFAPKGLRIARKIPFVGKVFAVFTERLNARAEKISQKSGERESAKMFSVFTFVAVPLPLTGIWAGALLAAILGLKSKNTFFALAAGNFVSAGVVLTVGLLAGEKAEWVLEVFLFVAIGLLFLALIKSLLSRLHAGRSL